MRTDTSPLLKPLTNSSRGLFSAHEVHSGVRRAQLQTLPPPSLDELDAGGPYLYLSRYTSRLESNSCLLSGNTLRNLSFQKKHNRGVTMNAKPGFFTSAVQTELPVSDVVAACLAQALAICGEGSAPEIVAAVLKEIGTECRWRIERARLADF